jgi:hypothetical protein
MQRATGRLLYSGHGRVALANLFPDLGILTAPFSSQTGTDYTGKNTLLAPLAGELFDGYLMPCSLTHQSVPADACPHEKKGEEAVCVQARVSPAQNNG